MVLTLTSTRLRFARRRTPLLRAQGVWHNTPIANDLRGEPGGTLSAQPSHPSHVPCRPPNCIRQKGIQERGARPPSAKRCARGRSRGGEGGVGGGRRRCGIPLPSPRCGSIRRTAFYRLVPPPYRPLPPLTTPYRLLPPLTAPYRPRTAVSSSAYAAARPGPSFLTL